MELRALLCVVLAFLRLQGSLADWASADKNLTWIFDVKNTITTQNQTYKLNPDTGAYRYHFDISLVNTYKFEAQSNDAVTLGCYGWKDSSERWHAMNYVADSHGWRVIRDVRQPIRVYPSFDEQMMRTFLDFLPQCLAFAIESAPSTYSVSTNRQETSPPKRSEHHDTHVSHGTENVHHLAPLNDHSRTGAKLSLTPFGIKAAGGQSGNYKPETNPYMQKSLQGTSSFVRSKGYDDSTSLPAKGSSLRSQLEFGSPGLKPANGFIGLPKGQTSSQPLGDQRSGGLSNLPAKGRTQSSKPASELKSIGLKVGGRGFRPEYAFPSIVLPGVLPASKSESGLPISKLERVSPISRLEGDVPTKIPTAISPGLPQKHVSAGVSSDSRPEAGSRSEGVPLYTKIKGGSPISIPGDSAHGSQPGLKSTGLFPGLELEGRFPGEPTGSRLKAGGQGLRPTGISTGLQQEHAPPGSNLSTVLPGSNTFLSTKPEGASPVSGLEKVSTRSRLEGALPLTKTKVGFPSSKAEGSVNGSQPKSDLLDRRTEIGLSGSKSIGELPVSRPVERFQSRKPEQKRTDSRPKAGGRGSPLEYEFPSSNLRGVSPGSKSESVIPVSQPEFGSQISRSEGSAPGTRPIGRVPGSPLGIGLWGTEIKDGSPDSRPNDGGSDLRAKGSPGVPRSEDISITGIQIRSRPEGGSSSLKQIDGSRGLGSPSLQPVGEVHGSRPEGGLSSLKPENVFSSPGTPAEYGQRADGRLKVSKPSSVAGLEGLRLEGEDLDSLGSPYSKPTGRFPSSRPEASSRDLKPRISSTGLQPETRSYSSRPEKDTSGFTSKARDPGLQLRDEGIRGSIPVGGFPSTPKSSPKLESGSQRPGTSPEYNLEGDAPVQRPKGDSESGFSSTGSRPEYGEKADGGLKVSKPGSVVGLKELRLEGAFPESKPLGRSPTRSPELDSLGSPYLKTTSRFPSSRPEASSRDLKPRISSTGLQPENRTSNSRPNSGSIGFTSKAGERGSQQESEGIQGSIPVGGSPSTPKSSPRLESASQGPGTSPQHHLEGDVPVQRPAGDSELVFSSPKYGQKADGGVKVSKPGPVVGLEGFRLEGVSPESKPLGRLPTRLPELDSFDSPYSKPTSRFPSSRPEASSRDLKPRISSTGLQPEIRSSSSKPEIGSRGSTSKAGDPGSQLRDEGIRGSIPAGGFPSTPKSSPKLDSHSQRPGTSPEYHLEGDAIVQRPKGDSESGLSSPEFGQKADGGLKVSKLGPVVGLEGLRLEGVSPESKPLGRLPTRRPELDSFDSPYSKHTSRFPSSRPEASSRDLKPRISSTGLQPEIKSYNSRPESGSRSFTSKTGEPGSHQGGEIIPGSIPVGGFPSTPKSSPKPESGSQRPGTGPEYNLEGLRHKYDLPDSKPTGGLYSSRLDRGPVGSNSGGSLPKLRPSGELPGTKLEDVVADSIREDGTPSSRPMIALGESIPGKSSPYSEPTARFPNSRTEVSSRGSKPGVSFTGSQPEIRLSGLKSESDSPGPKAGPPVSKEKGGGTQVSVPVDVRKSPAVGDFSKFRPESGVSVPGPISFPGSTSDGNIPGSKASGLSRPRGDPIGGGFPGSRQEDSFPDSQADGRAPGLKSKSYVPRIKSEGGKGFESGAPGTQPIDDLPHSRPESNVSDLEPNVRLLGSKSRESFPISKQDEFANDTPGPIPKDEWKSLADALPGSPQKTSQFETSRNSLDLLPGTSSPSSSPIEASLSSVPLRSSPVFQQRGGFQDYSATGVPSSSKRKETPTFSKSLESSPVSPKAGLPQAADLPNRPQIEARFDPTPGRIQLHASSEHTQKPLLQESKANVQSKSHLSTEKLSNQQPYEGITPESPPRPPLILLDVPSLRRNDETTSAPSKQYLPSSNDLKPTPKFKIPPGSTPITTYIPPPSGKPEHFTTELPHYLQPPMGDAQYCTCSCPRS